MPITKSAKKALRQSLRRREQNLIYKRKMKSFLKRIKKLIFQKELLKAKELLPQIYKILDKAAKVKVIKKNTASRKKSSIAKLLAKHFLNLSKK